MVLRLSRTALEDGSPSDENLYVEALRSHDAERILSAIGQINSRHPDAVIDLNTPISLELELTTLMRVIHFDLFEKFSNPAEIAQVLILRGADPNFQISNGEAAIHSAVSADSPETIRVLYDNNANLNAVGRDGTPLQQAFKEKKIKSVESLLDLPPGAVDIDARDANGASELHTAIAMGEANIVRKLIDKGADLAAKTKDGLGCYHIAAGSHNIEMINLIRAAYVEKQMDLHPIAMNPNNEDKHGFEPIHLAGSTQQSLKSQFPSLASLLSNRYENPDVLKLSVPEKSAVIELARDFPNLKDEVQFEQAEAKNQGIYGAAKLVADIVGYEDRIRKAYIRPLA
jgi:hypothetical protein